jgi:putative endonuclease
VRAELGRRGEQAAAEFLALRGYTIVARNVKIGRTELDLIARKGRVVVFCEVKTRRGPLSAFGAPEEAVDARKQMRILRAAEAYLGRRRFARDVRFDVIGVCERSSLPGTIAEVSISSVTVGELSISSRTVGPAVSTETIGEFSISHLEDAFRAW